MTALAMTSDPRGIATALLDAMTALLGVIERETALARSGDVAATAALSTEKSEHARRYAGAVTQFKAAQPMIAEAAPDLLATLHRHHDVFRAMLQVNLTVLATVHAVSEGIVRGVNAELQKKTAPQTYTAYGRNSAPPTRGSVPIAVSRSL